MVDPEKIKPFGLSQVYSSDKPLVDIVFVHGLNGHPYHTWTFKPDKTRNPDSKDVFWPTDLLPTVLDHVRILTYGYNAEVAAFRDGSNQDHIHHHAETLASGLAANRNLRKCSGRPIIFVCHSLGGLVVKRTLIYCRSVMNEKIEHLRSVFVSTYGILFLGTPHNGSDMAKWGSLLQGICSAVLPKRIMESSSQLINSLRTDNETLQNINSLFADMMPRYHIYFFHETRSTDVKGTRQVIVDESSAAPYIEGVERMGIEADHTNMCKFEDENAAGYEAVAEALLRYSEGAPALIADRWVEEEHARDLAKRSKAREIYNEDTDHPAGVENRSEHPVHSAPDPQINSGSALIHHPQMGNLPHIAQSVPITMPIFVPHADERDSPIPAQDITSSAQNTEPEMEQFFIVPPGFHPNATFYGMEKELGQIHNRLFKAKKRTERLTAVLIHGVPGSGKTHLARQYMWTQRECYSGGIFWVDAKSRQTTYKCYWEIAQRASLAPDGQQFDESDSNMAQKFVEEVRNWFQSRENWLIIYDGITFDKDEDLNLFKQVLPFKKMSSIIYTSVDRTLARKQRLYEPYCLSVPPLREVDACTLLLKDIGIKKPSRRQHHKAAELVKHYGCLPLAIHAISHRLSATGAPIEHYQVNAHLTDEKLAEPFLGIMHDLYRSKHLAALNLINLLAFLGHQVPVGLINLGSAALEAWDVQIWTTTRPGDRKEIDTTLGTLIRYGLLERTNSLSQQQSFSSSDGDETTDCSTPAPEIPESRSEGKEESFSESIAGLGAVDVIRIHTVIQGFCRDEMTIFDNERVDQPEAGSSGVHASWLVVTTDMFCASYEKARARMGSIDYGGMVKDYREYESHGIRLLDHFPKKSKKSKKHSGAPQIVRDAHRKLIKTLADIYSELQRLSRVSSQDLPPKLKSVFDRTSSSSSSAPDSSSEDNSREATLNLGDINPPQVESPQEISSRVHLDLVIPHGYRESSTGHVTDDEREPEPGPKVQKKGSKLSQMVQEVGGSFEPSSGWQEVAKAPRVGRRSRPKNSHPPRVASPEPALPVLSVFPVQRDIMQGSRPEKIRRGSQASAASESLAAVQGTSPSSRDSNRNLVLGSPPSEAKENMPNYPSTYANVAAKLINEPPKQRPYSAFSRRPPKSGFERSSAESLTSPSSHVSPVTPFPEFESDPMSRSASNEGGSDALARQLGAMNLRSGHEAQIPSLHGSTTLKSRQPAGDLTQSVHSLFAHGPQSTHIGGNTEMKDSRRSSRAGLVGPSASHFVSVQHPSAFMPGSSPTSMKDIPSGTATDSVVAAEPMTRGPSGASGQSWTTDPAICSYGYGVPHIPPNMEMTSAAPPIPPGLQPVSGMGGWAGEMHLPAQPIAMPAQPMPAANAQPATLHPEAAYAPRAPALAPEAYFSHQPVDLSTARHRLQGHVPLQLASPPNVPTYGLYHPNMSAPMIPQPSHEIAGPPRGIPARRGRSGSAPGYDGYRQ